MRGKESLVTLLQQVLSIKSSNEERKRPGSGKGKSKPVNPANDPSIPWDQSTPHTIMYEVKHQDMERNALLVGTIVIRGLLTLTTRSVQGIHSISHVRQTWP